MAGRRKGGGIIGRAAKERRALADVATAGASARRSGEERGRLEWRRLIRDWQFWLGLAVSLFFLYWAFLQANDLRGVARALANANYLYLLPALIVYFAGVAVRAVRWTVVLKPIAPLGPRTLFPVVVIGYMANNVLPARMGELVRSYLLSRDQGISKTTGLATIFVERVFDGLTMLLFVAVVALFVPLGAGIEGVARIAGVIFVVMLLLALVVAASPARASRLVSLALPLAPSAARSMMAMLADRFLSGLTALQSVRTTLAVLGLSVLAWLLEATMYYLVGVGFSFSLGFPAYLLTTAVVNLGTMVPSSPGYVGTFEALAVFTLGRFAVDGDLALSYTVALHATLLIPVTLLGFFYMWRRHVSLKLPEGDR